MSAPSRELIIRRATPDDAGGISRLIVSFLKEFTVDPSGAGAEKFLESVSAEAERTYILSDHYAYWIAEVKDELAGCIAMQGKTHVFHLFVAPRYQRQGLARALWYTAKEAAGEHGAVAEFTVNSSRLAVPVYERFGFERASAPVERHGISFIRMRYVPGANAS